MNIDARIQELVRIHVEKDGDENDIAPMMRTIVDEVLQHAKQQCASVKCDCGQVAIEAVRFQMWKDEARNREARRPAANS